MIQVTRFERSTVGQDDYAWAHRDHKTGNWSVFCNLGPAWFWSFETSTWECVVGRHDYSSAPMDVALSVLATCHTKRQIEVFERSRVTLTEGVSIPAFDVR